MSSSPTAQGPLLIRRALQQGWQAFARAPWSFMGFTMLAGGSAVLGQLLQNHGTDGLAAGREPATLQILMSLAGLIWSMASNLWMNVGLCHGASIALDGRRPSLAEFLHWDAPGMRRLLLIGLLLLLINLLILMMAGLAGGLLSLVTPVLGMLPLLAGGMAFLYLVICQAFHIPLAVEAGLDPLPVFRLGLLKVQPLWGSAALLVLLLAVILLAGLLLVGVGLVAAWPVVLCILVAAYRQIFAAPAR